MQQDSSPKAREHLSVEVGQMILKALPEDIRDAYLRRAAEIDWPVEAIIEGAIAAHLDPDCIDFTDCKPVVSNF